MSQVETTPSQFVDPSVYLWNISNNGELLRLEGFSAPPLRRNPHCADYASIRQQVAGRIRPKNKARVQIILDFIRGKIQRLFFFTVDLIKEELKFPFVSSQILFFNGSCNIDI